MDYRGVVLVAGLSLMMGDESYITFVQVQVTLDADPDALSRIMETFVVTDPSGI